MADINNKTIYAESVNYVITYTAVRPDNEHMTYNFTINTTLDSEEFLVVGVGLLSTVTVNGSSSQVRIKESQYSWSGGSTYTRTVSVTCASTEANTNQAVTFAVVSDGSISTTVGVVSNSVYTVKSAALLTTACEAPAVCAVDLVVAETSATLSWSEAAGGVNNGISSYQIQYSESSDNSTWGSWTALSVVETTETSGSLTVEPPSTRGYYRRFRVRTRGSAGSSYYSDWKISSNSVRKNTEPVRPTTVTASPAEYTGGTVTVVWSGAEGGTSAIKGYMIGRRTSTDDATWSSWSALEVFDLAATGGNRTVTPPYIPGIYVQYGVWTIDTFDVYSNERISDSIHCVITVCGAPTTCTLSAALAESDVTLAWSGALGGVGNVITAFEVQYAESADGSAWGDWTALAVVSATETSGSLAVSPSGTRGSYRKFRVRTRGSIGEAGYSGWTESSGSVRRKRLPPAPDIAAPAGGGSTYNMTPRVLITVGVEPDSQMQVAEVKLDGGEWLNSIDDAGLFSTGDELGDNTRTVFMGEALSPGTHTVTIRCYDELTQTHGAEVTRSFTVLAPPFEDITANVTHVKAAHMLALRSTVNAVRGYYGAAAYGWTDGIVAGQTQVRDWVYHIAEVRAAVEGVTDIINAFDAGISPPDWLPFGTGRPRADVMNQIAGVITTL